MSTRSLLLAFLIVATAGCSKPAERPQPPLVEEPATQAAAPAEAEVPEPPLPDLTTVDPATLNERAPNTFLVEFDTTEGSFTAQMHRDWAPFGVDRFYNLVRAGYYRDIAAFRVISGFMAQFGIHGDPAVNAIWRESKIDDDPRNRSVSNEPGTITFAMAGPNTRTVQLFINYGHNAMLDSQGFAPLGKVVEPGMDVVRSWYTGYGEGAPSGKGPDQMRTQTQGNEYLREQFPNLSYIRSIKIVK